MLTNNKMINIYANQKLKIWHKGNLKRKISRSFIFFAKDSFLFKKFPESLKANKLHKWKLKNLINYLYFLIISSVKNLVM